MKRTRKFLIAGSVFAFVLIAQSGCAGIKGTEEEVQAPAVQKEAAASITSGTVVEAIDAAGYTYVHLEKDGQENWVAVPTMELKKGEEVEFQPGMEMGPFTSKSLNRTFEKIVFSGGPKAGRVSPSATLPPGHPSLPSTAATQPPGHPSVDGMSATQPAGHPAVNAAGEPKDAKGETEMVAAPEKMLYSGKVAETIDAGKYTYVCLEKDGTKSWAAVPATKLEVGQEVEIKSGMEMGKFTSRTLNRTFENIIFSAGIVTR